MNSGQSWIVGAEEINHDEENESDGTRKPLLQRNEIPTKTPFLRMLFFGLIVAAPQVLNGMNTYFSSIALPQMNVNIDEASWFGSLQLFGSMFGAITIGFIMDKYGRRPSFIICIIASIIGWMLLGTSTNIHLMYLGQFSAGILSGCVYIGQIYAAEAIVINHHHLRNSFNVWSTIAAALGVILDTVLGRLVPYQTVALIAAAIAITSLIFIYIFIPESPRWLCQQGLIHRARLSEQQLCIYQPALNDFDHTRAVAEFDMKVTWQTFKNGLQKLKRKDVYKPLILMNVWFTLVIFTGGFCIAAYQVNILNDYPLISGSLDARWFGMSYNDIRSSYNLVIISGLLILAAVVLTSILVTHTGVKTLYSISVVGMIVGMIGLAVSTGIDEKYQNTGFWRSAHTASVWLITFFDSLGVTSIPISLIGEMLPYDAKGFTSIFSLSYCGIGGIVVKLHLYLYSYLGYVLYLIYAFVNLLNLVFVLTFIPETVGKTQEQIGRHFMK